MTEPDSAGPTEALIAEAIRFEDDWRWVEALEAWDRAREAAAGDDRLVGECESGRAGALFALERFEEADAADHAAAARFEAAGQPALARLRDASLAQRIGMSGKVDEALPMAEAARDAIDRLHDDPEAILAGARARQVVARLLFGAGRPDEGERQYVDARDRFADAGDDRRLARCDAALALDLLGAGRLEDAEGRAEAAVAGLMMFDCSLDAAQLQLVLGRLQAESERAEDALVNFRAANDVLTARELWPAVAEATHLEAMVLAATDQEEAAIGRFHDAIEVAARIGMDGGEGTSRLELALLLGRLGRLEEAATEFELAASALSKAGDEDAAAHATYGLGTAWREMGDLDRALGAFTSAAATFAVSGAQGAQAQARFDCGVVLGQMGRVDEALAEFDQAAAGFAVDGEPLHLALVRRAWGTTAGLAGRPEGVVALGEARAMFAEHGATWDVAECDGLTAQVLSSVGRTADAVEAAEACVAGFRSVGDPVGTIAAQTMLGHLLALAGRSAEAVDELEHAIAAATDEQSGPLVAQAHEALAEVLDTLERGPDAAVHRAAATRIASSVLHGPPGS